MREKERVHPAHQCDPPQRELALGLTYMQAIEAAGGLPVVLPPLAAPAIAPLLDRLDGLCLSGGPDLDPAGYGAERHPQLGPIEPEVDAFELELARQAWARRLPILAICRGMQALSVSRGGDLIQHLPDRVGGAIEHRQKEPAHMPTHTVELERRSLLTALMRTATVGVNSFHHQALGHVGSGLTVTARSEDGVIEGVEAPQQPFVLGVQWHAECLAATVAEQAALFGGFVRAARLYGTRAVQAA
jgi:putative glutamine amidotransferase